MPRGASIGRFCRQWCPCSVCFLEVGLTAVWELEYSDVDELRVELALATPLAGTGLGNWEDGADWAGVAGEWYVAARPFMWGGNVPLYALGTFTVSPCTLQETLAGFTSHFGRLPSSTEAAFLDPAAPFSRAREPVYFAGTNRAARPNGGPPAEAEMYVRGVVRLSTDNPPVAVWTWVVEGPNLIDERICARVVQMPGRGSAFFGVSAAKARLTTALLCRLSPFPGQRGVDDEGVRWMYEGMH